MRTRIIFFVLLVCLLLASCGGGAPEANANSTQAVATFVAQMTATANAAEIDSWLDESDETETPTPTDGPFLTATPDPNQQLLAKFRMVTVSQGNLYVRDGMGIPVQITSGGTDHDPIISSDGKKIAFYRGEDFDHVFMINADGSDEKEIINTKILPALDNGQVEFLIFRPKTSDLIFSSYFCGAYDCNVSVFLASSKLAEIAKFTSRLNDPSRDIPKFVPSADGQYLSVVTLNEVDLYSLDGNNAPSRMMEHPNTWSLFQYWLPDSSGLILLSPSAGSTSVWRYSLKDRHTEKILLNPAPVSSVDLTCSASLISPDRTWIFYQDHEQKKHLGNLNDSQTQVYDWGGTCGVQWSADSQHFASHMAIGSVDGTPVLTIADQHFIAWIDATHYLASRGKSVLDQQTYLVELGHESNAAQINFIWSPVFAVMDKP